MSRANLPEIAVERSASLYERGGYVELTLRLKAPFLSSPKGEVEVTYRVKDTSKAAAMIADFIDGRDLPREIYGISIKGPASLHRSFNQLRLL